jgi:environmental stress-induced protein Ves
MHVLRAADHKRMPWKNGGGMTTEIAVFRETAGLSDFDWRVSMARVEADGPFSIFPGVDRTLAILDGGGILLDVQGSAPVRLTRESEPHAFPADLPTAARLIDGAVTDLNVMSRRGSMGHSIRAISSRSASPAGNARLVFCATGSLRIEAGDESTLLAIHDALLLDDQEAAVIAPEDGGRGYLVTFLPEIDPTVA